MVATLQLPCVCDRLIRKSVTTAASIDDDVLVDGSDEEETEQDEGPENVDDTVRKREMRKGIDLATTLERIEKNFVITDPRLPDNPIVRLILIFLYYVDTKEFD